METWAYMLKHVLHGYEDEARTKSFVAAGLFCPRKAASW